MIGNTTWKKVWIGVQPSIMAASSISNGMLFTNPQNINTASPAPNPRYTNIIPIGLLKCIMFASLDNGNITIWNGTIMEKRHNM